jgi:TetR/AcrR family transcriptional regulator, regulator of cefoperazone and chloramphenicol sensitivity
MRSASDLTAAATIRDAAMGLFAERGLSGVTVRDIAAAAAVSPALVIHHYGSKSGLKDAVDKRAIELLMAVFAVESADPLGPDGFSAMSEVLVDLIDTHPSLMPYLRRLLIDGGPGADALFRMLYDGTVASLAALEAAGILAPTQDAALRAAFLLVNDLGAAILREQLLAVVGVDPLSRDGIGRWGSAVMEVYGGTLYRAPEKPSPGKKKGTTS